MNETKIKSKSLYIQLIYKRSETALCIVKEFLDNPTGRRYDALIRELNVRATKIILSKKLDKKEQTDLVSAGMDAIGHPEMFYQWLWTTIASEDAKPIDLIRDGEIKKVLHMLGPSSMGYILNDNKLQLTFYP